jgi:NADH-quinone oxidoreductase subunit F
MNEPGLVHRVTVPAPIESLAAYVDSGGGGGLEAASTLGADAALDMVAASGLRGRGGAGFPTASKWSTVRAYRSGSLPTAVVVNAAEGEPGTFKDRHLLVSNPYQVLEGALIAAGVVGADEVIVGLKRKEGAAVGRLRVAVQELVAEGWADDVAIRICEGPDEYLFGEETALLEVIDHRPPFPRIAPPWRRGVLEVIEDGADVAAASNLSAEIEMAGATDAPPALVSNVETMANVALILRRGADWFRTEGTDRTPGTFVCTVTGDTVTAGVGEVPAGTTLRRAIELIGGDVAPGRRIKAVLSGVSNRVITADLLDTPITYEDMRGPGIGPGSAGFIVFDDTTDMVAVAAGVARFLAIESCGQCTPCKQDGLAIAGRLAAVVADEGTAQDVETVDRLVATVADGARCFLASQQQLTIGSILDAFHDEFAGHLSGRTGPAEPSLISELIALSPSGGYWDERHLTKQPDWEHGVVWSGQTPADRLRDQVLDRQLDG